MIIWGWKGRETVQQSGEFHCPQCRGSQPYEQYRVSTYFTLYFIPLFETQHHGDYIKCRRCNGQFNPVVLQMRGGGGSGGAATLRAGHYALTAEQAARLKAIPGLSGGNLLAFVDEIRNKEGGDWAHATKSWDPIHRCLTDGELSFGNDPLHRCILGDVNLLETEGCVANLLSADEVESVAAVIKDLDRTWFRRKYDAIDTATYGELSDDDFNTTWKGFQKLQGFYQKAAAERRDMLFLAEF